MKTALSTFTFILLACDIATAAMRPIGSPLILPAPRVSALAAADEKHFYLADEGGVHFVTLSGETIRTLPATAPDGRPILKRPRGIAVVAEKIFIADAKLDHVAVFNTAGAYLGILGREGDKPKEFASPSAVAACSGLLFVADSGNARVQVFSPDGIYLTTIGRSGTGDALLGDPTHLAVDPAGRLVVLDEGKIKLFLPTGEFLRSFATPHRPVALAADNEGILLADAEVSKVVKIDYEGKELFSFGSRGSDRSQFLAIGSLAVSPCGRMLVGDPEKGVVHVLALENCTLPPRLAASPALTSVRVTATVGDMPLVHLAVGHNGTLYGITDGKEKRIAAITGQKAGQTIHLPKWNPVALSAAQDGTLWVLDRRENKVLHFSPEGDILGSFGSSGAEDGSFDSPADLLVSPRGMIYVADRDNKRVQVFNGDGILLHVLGGKRQEGLFAAPCALALDPQENLFVLDSEKKTVSAFDPEGKPLLAFAVPPQRLVKPVSLAVTTNEIQILDSRQGAVQVFSRKGEFLRSYATAGEDPGDLSDPADLVALDDTDFLVADNGNRRLQTFQMIYSPAPPGKVAGTAGQRLATLEWEKNAESYVLAYKVYRSTKRDDGYEEIARTSDSTLNDAAVQPDTAYFYRVTALARNGYEGAASATIEITPTRLVPPLPAEIKATPQEWSVDLGWTAEKPEIVAEYRVYRQIDGRDVLLGTSKIPSYYDGNLDPETAYEYQVSAVSIDGVESPRAAIRTMTLVTTRPPLEIVIARLDDIFSNTYKVYETKGVGKVKITNNTRDQLSHIKVAFTLKDFMDFPSEIEISNLGPHASEELILKAIFNNLILNLTEDTTVQAEIVASYYKNQNLVKFSAVQPIRLFEKHRMTWDERERFAAFVTPKDPVILEFGRSVASQFSEFADPILFAGAAFDALGLAGVGYLQDPSNPYQVTSDQTDFVDFIQYPRETLARRSGDCDDLVGLYGAILESLGIRTQVVEVPGHMFLLFDTLLLPDSVGAAARGMYVEHQGTLWIPVEVTQVGSPFMKAWETGVKSYQSWREKDLTLMDIRAAWGTFKPATLPMNDWRAPAIGREDLENRFKDDLPTLRKIRLQNLGQRYLARLQSDPKDASALLQLGILYARAGEPKEAVDPLEKACALLADQAGAHNNLGNVYFLLENYPKAESAYRRAAELGADDPDILVNLARVLLRLELKTEAAESFGKALAMRPDIAEKYRSLAIHLGASY